MDATEHVEELVHVGSIGTKRSQAGDRPGALDLVSQVAQRPAPGALLGLLLDHSVSHLDHRFDRQHRPEQGPSASDPSALPEILERVDSAVHLHLPHHRFRRAGDLVEARSPPGPLGRLDGDQALAQRDAQRVDDPNRNRTFQPSGRLPGRLDRRRHLRGEVDADHSVGAFGGHSLESALELAGGGGRRLGQAVEAGTAGPELLGGQLRAVHQLLGAEPDPQRHQPDTELGEELVGQVASTVGHHSDARHFPPFGVAPGRSRTVYWTRDRSLW